MALLRRPGASYALIQEVAPPPCRGGAARRSRQRWSSRSRSRRKYAGYIARQQAQVAKMARLETRRIPAHFGYEGIPGLRDEAREQLLHYRPLTLGQAARLSGVTPADVVILMVHLDRGEEHRAIEAAQS